MHSLQSGTRFYSLCSFNFCVFRWRRSASGGGSVGRRSGSFERFSSGSGASGNITGGSGGDSGVSPIAQHLLFYDAATSNLRGSSLASASSRRDPSSLSKTQTRFNLGRCCLHVHGGVAIVVFLVCVCVCVCVCMHERGRAYVCM
jgi:hypothetical protein